MSLWDPVYQLVKQIPRGRVMTYGGLAKALRLPGGARSAGRAMGATPQGQGIPWQRVVGERGRILISGPHAMLQKKLLESEGLAVIESRAQIAGYEWKPPSKRRVTPRKATSKPRSAKKTNPKKMPNKRRIHKTASSTTYG
jgi:methylated-DNA-protein-cysteine methyltransferase-like protein